MNDGYMDAAAVPVPDAGDDTLREQLIADGRCPTCQMATRETKGMICQTCGTDYAGGETP